MCSFQMTKEIAPALQFPFFIFPFLFNSFLHLYFSFFFSLSKNMSNCTWMNALNSIFFSKDREYDSSLFLYKTFLLSIHHHFCCFALSATPTSCTGAMVLANLRLNGLVVSHIIWVSLDAICNMQYKFKMKDLLMHARDSNNKQSKNKRQEIMIHPALELIPSTQMNRFQKYFSI